MEAGQQHEVLSMTKEDPSMDMEDAVEIVIGILAWVDCPQCDAIGYTESPPGDGSRNIMITTCGRCKASRKAISPKFVQACQMVGKKPEVVEPSCYFPEEVQAKVGKISVLPPTGAFIVTPEEWTRVKRRVKGEDSLAGAIEKARAG